MNPKVTPNPLRRYLVKALNAARVTDRDLSREAGFHESYLPRGKAGISPTTSSMLRALAAVLRKRAGRMQQVADELERVAGKEGPNEA